jgi:hypothetical protein
MRHAPYLFLLLSLAMPADSASAQFSTPPASACDGRIVSAITIISNDPSFLKIPRFLRPLARGVGLHHTTTKMDVIRRFLLLEVGQPCVERQRAESERILRFQPFLAQAAVRAVADGAGGVDIEVETLDEIPTVFDMRLRDRRPSALRIGNGNVAGRGIYLAARWEQGYAYRTGFGVQLIDHQALGHPYTLAIVADRAPLGSTVSIALAHTFITDLQHSAWHAGVREIHDYTSFVRPDGEALSLAARRRFAAVGGVWRVGVRGRSAFIGGLITHERVIPEAQGVIISDSGLVADTTGALNGPFEPVRNVRLNVVVGIRSVAYLAARGFDALVAAQDVAKGVQFGAILGQGVTWFGSGDGDVFLSADLYAGAGSAHSFAALQVEGEAARNRDAHRWDAMVASGRLAWYVKPTAAHLFIASGELSGTGRGRFPVQLRLGDRQGGVRGYRGSRVAGAVRTVGRFEARWAIGRLTRHLGLGLAGFTDVGKTWAGDAPFGVDSPVKTGVGLGLLAAIPPRSRRLWRLDVAVPVSADAHAGWEVRLTALRVTGFWREPSDVARARAGAATATIFTWP